MFNSISGRSEETRAVGRCWKMLFRCWTLLESSGRFFVFFFNARYFTAFCHRREILSRAGGGGGRTRVYAHYLLRARHSVPSCRSHTVNSVIKLRDTILKLVSLCPKFMIRVSFISTREIPRGLSLCWLQQYNIYTYNNGPRLLYVPPGRAAGRHSEGARARVW